MLTRDLHGFCNNAGGLIIASYSYTDSRLLQHLCILHLLIILNSGEDVEPSKATRSYFQNVLSNSGAWCITKAPSCYTNHMHC